MARPTDFKKELGEIICTRLVQGKDGKAPESLRSICDDEDMPDKTTVLRWLRRDEPEFVEFRTQYARAREDQAEMLADEIIDISDDSAQDWVQREGRTGFYMAIDTEAVMRSKLRVDSRKWWLAKLLPKKYGDITRLEHSGPDGGPIPIGQRDPDALVARAIELGLVDRLPPALAERARKLIDQPEKTGENAGSCDNAGHEAATDGGPAQPGGRLPHDDGQHRAE